MASKRSLTEARSTEAVKATTKEVECLAQGPGGKTVLWVKKRLDNDGNTNYVATQSNGEGGVVAHNYAEAVFARKHGAAFALYKAREAHVKLKLWGPVVQGELDEATTEFERAQVRLSQALSEKDKHSAEVKKASENVEKCLLEAAKE